VSIERDITRRQAVRGAGLAAAVYVVAPALLVGGASSQAAQAATRCPTLTPELTEGPYWVNAMLRRADIRANTGTAGTSPGASQKGVPLDLTINIHVRVRKLSSSGATIAGYTTQIFFSDADNDRVLTGAAPYISRSPQKDPTTDENDTVLQHADDATNIASVKGSLENGFSAAFNVMLEHSAVVAKGSLSRPTSGGGPPPAGGR
jgi:hypothetical protein